MNIHAEFDQRVVLDTTRMEWVDSPVTGIRRKMLERQGDEVARATSIVRYAPGSRFSPHTHGLGEEILVLEGTLNDETGQFGSGTYIKNPPGSSHAPYSLTGCTLLVKLRHLDPTDTERIVIDTHAAAWRPGLVPGLAVMPLSEFGTQHTALVRWAPGTEFRPHSHFRGEEIYVIDGVFEDECGPYPAGTWMRSPHLSNHRPFSTEGCLIFVKTGHLPPATTRHQG